MRRAPLLLLLLLPATATARPAPTLPASFRADIVRHVTEAGDPHVTNLTAAYDAASSAIPSLAASCESSRVKKAIQQ